MSGVPTRVALAACAVLLLPLVLAMLFGSSVLIGDMIVVGKELERGSNAQTCIDYRAYGQTERVCVPAGTTASIEIAARCFAEARIGEPLPKSCR